jgi:hypothetical protein
LEISQGKSKNGEDILTIDFIFEVERQAHGLNERSQQEKISVPRERILTQDKTASQVADELVAEYFKGVSDSTKVKAKLEVKILWFRSFTIPEVAKRPLKYLMKLLQTACK